MAKEQGGGKLLPLPFMTFGEALALLFEASVYCSRCYEHRPIEPAAEHLRDRCFATARFRCTKIRYTGAVCGCPGSVGLMPTARLPVGANYDLAFLSCEFCAARWEINFVPIEQPPWSVVKRKAGDRFRCPGCSKAVACAIHGPTWRPVYSDSKLP